MDPPNWNVTIGVLFIAILLYIQKAGVYFWESPLPSQYLVIGVLSARSHFSYREVIRKTWASELHRIPNSKLVFVVGETDCHIHPADRKSVYSCDEWHILNEDIVNPGPETFVKFSEVAELTNHNKYECNTGIGFKILHSVVIDAVSVRYDILKRRHSYNIILKDAEEVFESVPIEEEKCMEENGFCVLRLPSALLLPRDFEGELLLKGNVEDDEVCGEHFFENGGGVNMTCDWTKSSAIEFRHFRTRKDVIKEWNSLACCAVSLRFKISETDVLKRHIEGQSARSRKWLEYTEVINTRITEEQLKNKDLLILPLQDFYSNLARKTKVFLKWVSDHYNSTFVMKADDDTFVNVKQLQAVLASGDGKGSAWWSDFQYHRQIPIYGKSANAKYPGLTYPTFPSGAGYLMTGTLANGIAHMGNSLPIYAGEDVSLGIWVTIVATDVKTFDVPCWLSHSKCKDSVLKSQLTESQMISHWNSYLKEN